MIALTILLLLNLLATMDCAPHRRSHLRTLRLCSKRLSDALYLVCSDTGYNEPFPYNDEDKPRGPPGPGLVEECCYHSCSYEQLEQYCKPTSEEKRGGSRDVIEESIRIVNLPDSSTEIQSPSREEKTRSNHHTKKGKDCRTKNGRKQGHGNRSGECH
ncbi:hypothetical protein KPH14_004566 [Odynerus spinipes]|uniref:Insulin-like domain-containing protein n=1 Tax=Odynerus spinipes TaxID=1348599 RepID=A0AAD9VPS3_9HYME|nr:hypothetical protein KPH14_004566 [Odynerus spinipes]